MKKQEWFPTYKSPVTETPPGTVATPDQSSLRKYITTSATRAM